MQIRRLVVINGLLKNFLVAAYAVSRLLRKGVEAVVLKCLEKANSVFDPG
jgi:hypothetical protein